MSFTESLPADKRHLLWEPTKYLMLTLPDLQGVWTAFEVKRSRFTDEEAWNIALYRPAEDST